MTLIERCERALARLTWRLYRRAAESCGEDEARGMVGDISRDLMERYPEGEEER